MAVVLNTFGVAIIALALKDVFHTLFHPSARGDVSNWIALRIWRSFRRVLRHWLSFAGPVAFIATVGYWTASLIVGFALIYKPRLPHGFVFVTGLRPESHAGMWSSVVISLNALTNGSMGIYAGHTWLAAMMGFEGLLGFVLLSAVVSWILSIYPVLEHRRSLALQGGLLHFAEVNGIRRLESMPDSDLQELLFSFAAQVTKYRNELTQFPIAYYFAEVERKTRLPGTLGYLARLADEASSRGGGVPIAATALGAAIDDYLDIVAKTFLRRKFSQRCEILTAYANDHFTADEHR